MKWKLLYFAIIAFFILLVVGCSNNQQIGDVAVKGSYENENVRKIAWEFLEEQGWTNTAKEDWKSAKLKMIVAVTSYELFDQAYVGKEILAISFEDKENVVAGTPIILIDPDTNGVIGYIAGE